MSTADRELDAIKETVKRSVQLTGVGMPATGVLMTRVTCALPMVSQPAWFPQGRA